MEVVRNTRVKRKAKSRISPTQISVLMMK